MILDVLFQAKLRRLDRKYRNYRPKNIQFFSSIKNQDIPLEWYPFLGSPDPQADGELFVSLDVHVQLFNLLVGLVLGSLFFLLMSMPDIY